jgi:hypothetical protein
MGRRGASGYPARFEHQNLAGHPVLTQQSYRHKCCLAGTGRGDQNCTVRPGKNRQKFRQFRFDRQAIFTSVRHR